MKNYINYYYGLDVKNLVLKKDKYFFYTDNVEYIFKECDNVDVEVYYPQLSRILAKYKYFLNVVTNKENSLITFINNKPYILLKKNFPFYDEKICIFDINPDIHIDIVDEFLNLKRFPWINLWENKIDYLENWIFEKKNKYKDIYPILNYYLGLSENALLYLKESLKSNISEATDLTIQHIRLDVDSCLDDYYDPTLVIIDHSSRDISEYIKSAVMSGSFEIDLLERYLDRKKFSKYWIMIMYSRILFPSFFYDCFEEFIIKKSSMLILDLEDKIKNYQMFLFQISKLLNDKYGIDYPKWIFKTS